MELYNHVKEQLSDVETIMEIELQQEDERVYGMLVPFLKRGGKRMRPVLCLISCGAVGGEYSEVLEPAAIIELFHNFTLIHDDIEDDSRFRRGEPTLHVTHGLPIALNSGDALYTLLWGKLVSISMKPSKLIALQRLFAESFKQVVEGQGIELSWIRSGRFDITEEEYLDMVKGKTSGLVGLSCEVGAFVGGGNKRAVSALRDFGEKIGTAFQIQDDVLNVSGDFEKYKKEIGGDISEGKRTLMIVHCLGKASSEDKQKIISILSSHSKKEEDISSVISILQRYGSVDYAKDIARSLISEAKEQLNHLPSSKDRESLSALADYVIEREL